jgi:signal transduction histidine kinase
LFEPNGIDCELRLDRNLPEVRSLPSHLKQVITNLLKNSVEALESKGEGTITVETNDAVYFDGRRCVRIVVADNGPGIAPNIIDHLFTSAISSKGAPHSGVGLMVVKGLVSEMGGNVLVYSTEENGTRFEIFLPKG